MRKYKPGLVDMIKNTIRPKRRERKEYQHEQAELIRLQERREKFRTKMLNEKGEFILSICYNALNKSNIKVWLEFGTLLGAYREGDFIKHDTDIDLAAFLEDASKIHKALTGVGFHLIREFRIAGSDKLERCYKYEDIPLFGLDVFFYSEEGDEFVGTGFSEMGDFNGKTGTFSVQEFHFPKFELEKYTFKGINVYVPKDIHNHLSYIYGESYMISDSSFTNSPNKKYIPFHEQMGYALVLPLDIIE